MRGQYQYWQVVVDDLKKALHESLYPEVLKKETAYITNADGVEAANLTDVRELSFDIETTGLNPFATNALTKCCAFSAKEGEAIHLNFAYPTSREIARVLLEDPYSLKIVQRGTFDIPYLEQVNGIKVKGNLFDTKIAQHLLNPELPTDLAFLASLYTDVPFYKAKDVRPDEPIYNCTDADVTYRIKQKQQVLLEQAGLTPLFKTSCKLIRPISKMQLRGVKVDVDAINTAVNEIEGLLKQTEAIFYSKGINVRSGLALGQVMRAMGASLKHTPTGRIKTDAESLRQVDHPLARHLLKFKELDKLYSTFLKGMEARLHNGRIHTTYNITGTVTGRLSSSDPNLQNIPRRVRHIFIPDKDYFIEADYSQFEIRVAAAVIPSESLQKDLDSGIKIHHKLAQEVYHRELETLTDKEILRTKAVVFGTIYGRSARSIALEHKITISEAQELQSVIEGRYPEIKEFKSKLLADRFFVTPFGRRREFGENVTELFNFPIQSSAADILRESIVLLDEEGLDLVLTVHDNVILDCNKHELRIVLEALQRIMQRPMPILNNTTFPVKISLGANWRDLDEIPTT